jgi:regulatory protein
VAGNMDNENNLSYEEFQTQKKYSEESSFKRGMEYAIRILSLRDYSIFKMKKKLSDRNINPEHTEEVINRLLELKYLREDEYTLMRIKQLLLKGYANSFILQKLSQEQLIADDHVINTLREEQDMNLDKQLHMLIEKKLRSKNIPNDPEQKMKLKNKVISFLSSKGYNYDQIKKALQEYIS